MSNIILIVAVIAALLVVSTSIKRRKENSAKEHPLRKAEPLMANEAGPTQTGRYRVKEMLMQTEKKGVQKSVEQEIEDAKKEDDEALPDPFDH